MNNELFERMMTAVDEDLLEEAQRPAKAKRPWATLAVSAAACLALVAVGALRTQEPAQPDPAMVANPLQAVTAAEVEQLGYRLSLPGDVQEPSYYLINLGAEHEAPMAEVRFERSGGDYTCRTLKTAAAEDISGLYTDWDQSHTWTAGSLEVTLMAAENLAACVSWYEEASGTQWCLSAEQGAADVLNTAAAMMDTLGYDLDVAPEGAEETAFRALAQDDLTVGETTFVLDGISCAYRVAATNAVEEEFADISGVGADFTEEAEGEIGWCRARLAFDAGAGGKVVWFDPAPGLLYSLYMESGASEEALLEMAELLYDPAQDDAG